MISQKIADVIPPKIVRIDKIDKIAKSWICQNRKNIDLYKRTSYSGEEC